jgi:hypothetical protein
VRRSFFFGQADLLTFLILEVSTYESRLSDELVTMKNGAEKWNPHTEEELSVEEISHMLLSRV